MRARIGVVLSVIALCTGSAVLARQSPPGGRIPLDAHRSLGAPASFRNLALVPVFDSAARPKGNYLTLDEGLRSKLVTVEESPAGGEVNTLFITNRAKDPLYLMAGEVVLGGQQDRCLGRDTVVPPGSVKFAVPVFCVEHGRWNGSRQFDSSAKAVASAEIRGAAQSGAFHAQAGGTVVAANAPPSPPAAGRVSRRAPHPTAAVVARQRRDEARVGEAQQQVWDRVAAKNRAFKAAPATGTYREVLNLSAADAQQSVAPYERSLTVAIPNDPHLVGVVAAVNGKVVAADIFGDPGLFRKLWPKLLRSYAADAAENAPGKNAKTPAVTAAQAKAFLLDAARARPVAGDKTRATTLLRQESKEAVMYRLVPNSPPAAGRAGGMGGFGGGGFGGALHEGIIRK